MSERTITIEHDNIEITATVRKSDTKPFSKEYANHIEIVCIAGIVFDYSKMSDMEIETFEIEFLNNKYNFLDIVDNFLSDQEKNETDDYLEHTNDSFKQAWIHAGHSIKDFLWSSQG